MNGNEMDSIVTNGQVQWSGAGITALVLFAAAFILNKWGRERDWTPYVVLAFAVLASFVFHASSWSANMGTGIAGWMNSHGWPATLVMGLAFFLSVFVIVADLKADPRVNGWAVTMLLIAPITAHGTSGWVASIVGFAYELVTALAVGLVTNLFGN